jgi:hypothetical protein
VNLSLTQPTYAQELGQKALKSANAEMADFFQPMDMIEIDKFGK